MKRSFALCNSCLVIAMFLAVFGGLAQAATVDTLALIAQSGGQYDYAIQLAPNHGLVFTSGDQIILTGLSGVTGASVLPGLSICFSVATTTPVSATIFSSNQCPVFDPVPTGVSIGALRLFSSVVTAGPINYQIQTGNEGTLSGTVAGPVSIPEPGAGALAALGLFVFFGLRRISAAQISGS